MQKTLIWCIDFVFTALLDFFALSLKTLVTKEYEHYVRFILKFIIIILCDLNMIMALRRNM